MAGLFGNLMASSPALQAGVAQAYQPGQYSLADKLALLGAGIHQVTNGGNDIADAQQQIAGRTLAQQRLMAQQQLMGLFTPSSPQGGGQQGGGAPGGGSGLPDIASIAPQLMAAQAAGLDVTPYLNILEKSRPHVTSVGRGGTLMDDTGAVVGRGTPEGGVADGFGYTVDPITGMQKWTNQRPRSYSETLSQDQFNYQKTRDPILDRFKGGEVGAALTNAGANVARTNQDINTGGKPKPWDRSWK